MFRYIKGVLLIIVISLFLTGCYSKSERKLARQYEKQGKDYAINYVKEKYGFPFKVKSVIAERNCDVLWGCLDSSPSGNVDVKLKANNKTFSVTVFGLDDGEVSAADDYQHEKIEKDLINYLKENISFNLYDYKVNTFDLITEYYDNNLEDMLRYIDDVELYYIGENDLSVLDINKIESFWKNDHSLKLINFKSRENCEKYKKVHFENLSLTSEEMKNIYIDNIIEIKDGKKEFYQINNITNYNDKVYIYAYKDNSSHAISLSKMNSLKNYQKLYKELKNRKIEQVTDAYSILGSSSVLYIYFPKEVVNARSSDKLFFAYECYVNQEKKYYIDDYYGLDSELKMGTDGNYYIHLKNFSYCDVNSEVVFSVVKIY